ncbi:MAG: hypothetical protein EZS28_002004 [Streblomastix strix]|uniref:Uncharacterized protein n=1 Tax=Streblomastix strix TaxID=222440 RepID=A0A5J4X5H3_9EUKA|nr:MAG: hypothetical protein EZS28_002004 [Streblomastix strix]
MVLKIESPKPAQISDDLRRNYQHIYNRYQLILVLILAALSSCRLSQGRKIVQGIKETDAIFLSVADTEETLNKLKITVTLISDELRYDIMKQVFVSGYYQLIGYSAFYQRNADISPSITYLTKAGFSEVTVKKAPKELTVVPDFNEIVTFQQKSSSGDLDILILSTSNIGLGGTSCVPNTVVPDDASKYQIEKIREIVDDSQYWIYSQTFYDGETELVWIDSDDYDFTGLDATVFFNDASVVRAVLSVIVATVVIPALLLFW